jgi:hypothetical protein
MTGQSCLVSHAAFSCSKHLEYSAPAAALHTQSWSKTFCSIQASAPGDVHWLMAQANYAPPGIGARRRALGNVSLCCSQCMPLLKYSSPYTHSADLTSLSVQASAPEDVHWLMAQANYAPVMEYCGGTEIGGAFCSSTMIHPNVPSCFAALCLGMDLLLLEDAESPRQASARYCHPLPSLLVVIPPKLAAAC